MSFFLLPLGRGLFPLPDRIETCAFISGISLADACLRRNDVDVAVASPRKAERLRNGSPSDAPLAGGTGHLQTPPRRLTKS